MEPSTLASGATLQPYSPAPASWNQRWGLKSTQAEAAQAAILAERVVALSADGLTGQDIVAAWVSRWIQPLQERGRGIWMYSGGRDLERTSPLRLDDHTFETRMRRITRYGACISLSTQRYCIQNSFQDLLVK